MLLLPWPWRALACLAGGLYGLRTDILCGRVFCWVIVGGGGVAGGSLLCCVCTYLFLTCLAAVRIAVNDDDLLLCQLDEHTWVDVLSAPEDGLVPRQSVMMDTERHNARKATTASTDVS